MSNPNEQSDQGFRPPRIVADPSTPPSPKDTDTVPPVTHIAPHTASPSPTVAEGSSSRAILGSSPPPSPPPAATGPIPAPAPAAATGQQPPHATPVPNIPGDHAGSAKRALPLPRSSPGPERSIQITVKPGKFPGSSSGAGSSQRKRLRGDPSNVGGSGGSSSGPKAAGGSGGSSGSPVVFQPGPAAPTGPHPCTVEGCTKSFLTLKALHGHMRAHSGRPWRGTFPPPTFTQAELSVAFRRTMDIVGGRIAADTEGGDGEKEEGEVTLEEGGPVVAAVTDVLAEEGTKDERPDLNEKSKESLEAELEEQRAAAGQTTPTTGTEGEEKAFNLNEFPPPDNEEE